MSLDRLLNSVTYAILVLLFPDALMKHGQKQLA